MSLPPFALALHGGAGTEPARMSAQERREWQESLAMALALGEAMLSQGRSAVETVEAVVRWLEDDPRYNAGVGSCFNREGEHELDAAIMDGRTRACGAIAGVTTVKNPITLARLVMTQSRHVLLIAEGAEKFADEMGVERVPNSYFATETARQKWERARARAAELPRPNMGTVGCVAWDRQRNLAAATSTGGVTNKRAGRVGDTPIIGGGTYADNATCAVSCTGNGENFIRHAVAYDLHARLAYAGESLAHAVEVNLRQRLSPGDGGLIAVDRLGNVVLDFTSDGMAHAAVDAAGRRVLGLGELGE
jgi:beta-aspartyl-peptidase (threonine type)